MDKQKKSVGGAVLVILLLIVTVASLVLATYAWARYTTVETEGATAQVAKWDVTFTENSNGIFRGTYNHVVDQRLAPGMTGSFDLSVQSVNTETDYDYRMALTHVTNKPTNLHFYSDSGYAHEITTDVGSFIYGHVDIDTAEGENQNKAHASVTKTIYWKWDYQTADITALPADVSTTYEGTTKQARIVHDLNVLLVQKGLIASETDANALPANATLEQMLAKASGETLTTAEIKKAINDAIDTVDGMRAATMSLDVELTAIQCDPATGKTEYSTYIN